MVGGGQIQTPALEAGNFKAHFGAPASHRSIPRKESNGTHISRVVTDRPFTSRPVLERVLGRPIRAQRPNSFELLELISYATRL